MGDNKVIDAEPVDTQALATSGETALSTDVLDVSMYEAEAGAGSENVGTDDLQTQFLTIIESNSGFLKKTDGRYIKGAEAGQIVNSVTRQVFDGEKGIFFIPCFYSKEVIEWNPDNKIVERHALDSAEYQKAKAANRRNGQNKLVNEAGNEMRETASQAGLLCDLEAGAASRVVIAMTGTRLKKSKRLNTLVGNVKVAGSTGREINPPRYTQVYKLKVVGESSGTHDFFNWEPVYQGLVTSKALYAEAKAYYEMLKATGVQAAPPEEHSDAGSGSAGEGPEIPF